MQYSSCLRLTLFSNRDEEEATEAAAEGNDEQNATPAPKKSIWARPSGKKQHKGGAGAKNKHKGGKVKQNVAHKPTVDNSKTTAAKSEKPINKDGGDSDANDSAAEDSDNENEKNDVGSDRSSDEEKKVSSVEDDDEEWDRFQQKMNKREKLEGKSKISHSVHCPYFPEDKQEYWWTYICDRKSRTLLTAPYHVTNLVGREEIQLKFTAPRWPGVYTFAVCLRSG